MYKRPSQNLPLHPRIYPPPYIHVTLPEYTPIKHIYATLPESTLPSQNLPLPPII